MKKVLENKLHQYLRENNPDVLIQLEEDNKVSTYLSDKINTVDTLLKEYEGQPEYIIEEVCMNELIKDLRPSKFNYISNILEEEFEKEYRLFQDSCALRFEVINLIHHCQDMFELFGFTEDTEDSNDLKNIVTGMIANYLENVDSEL